MQPAKEIQSARPMIVEAVNLFNRMAEIREQIARRAYELFEGRGHEHGRALDDWTMAESELMAPVSVEVMETVNRIEVAAEVPGFNENNIEIALEPRRLFLSGKKEKALEPDIDGLGSDTRQATMFFGTIDLPADVDPTKAEARLEDGHLTLILPKLTAEENLETEAAQEIPVE